MVPRSAAYPSGQQRHHAAGREEHVLDRPRAVERGPGESTLIEIGRNPHNQNPEKTVRASHTAHLRRLGKRTERLHGVYDASMMVLVMLLFTAVSGAAQNLDSVLAPMG